MRHSRPDLVPLLAMITGGTLGVLTLSPLAIWVPADDAGDLYSVVTSGGEPQLLFHFSDEDPTPQISPDGQWIAYRSDEGGEPRIYVRSFPQVTGRR